MTKCGCLLKASTNILTGLVLIFTSEVYELRQYLYSKQCETLKLALLTGEKTIRKKYGHLFKLRPFFYPCLVVHSFR